MVKPQLAIVHTVAAHLVTHILHSNARADAEVWVADAHQQAMNAVVGATHIQLCKHHAPVCVHGTTAEEDRNEWNGNKGHTGARCYIVQQC